MTHISGIVVEGGMAWVGQAYAVQTTHTCTLMHIHTQHTHIHTHTHTTHTHTQTTYAYIGTSILCYITFPLVDEADCPVCGGDVFDAGTVGSYFMPALYVTAYTSLQWLIPVTVANTSTSTVCIYAPNLCWWCVVYDDCKIHLEQFVGTLADNRKWLDTVAVCVYLSFIHWSRQLQITKMSDYLWLILCGSVSTNSTRNVAKHGPLSWLLHEW